MDSEVAARILIVDDSPGALYATGRILREAGYQTVEASTGTAALERAADVQLVVLDINLPDIDGFEVCRRLRANPATTHLPVLHLSATFVEREDLEAGLEAGADSYLTRPVEPLVLLATVRTLLFAQQADLNRRRLVARLRAMFDLAPIPMATIDAKGRLESANPAFCTLSGFGPGELTGMALTALLQTDLALQIAPGEPASAPQSGQGQLRRKEASAAQVEWQLGLDASSGMRILALTDITERQRAEQERERLLASERAARAEAERSNRLKEEFLATLSHELRTPLSAILGWSAVIGRQCDLPPVVADGMKAIERNSRLQAQMISDLLDYAGIAYGKIRFVTRIIDPYPVVRAALDVVQAYARSCDVRIEADIADTPVQLDADPDRLQQMVWNLLSNAIKFSSTGSHIELRAGPQNGRFRVTVRDYGQGIAPDFLPHIFERFSQQDATNRRRHGGLGLGLAIVKQLAELHGGEVRADSAGEQRGSTFTIELPLSEAHQGSAASESQRSRQLDLRGLRVLVVEDDSDTRTLIRFVLVNAGAEIQEAASAQQALSLVRQQTPDLLVSDIGMAGQNGYELLRRLRSEGYSAATLPAIALTAFGRAEDRQEALAAGFQDYVVKPFDAQALLLRVAAHSQSIRSGQAG